MSRAAVRQAILAKAETDPMGAAREADEIAADFYSLARSIRRQKRAEIEAQTEAHRIALRDEARAARRFHKTVRAGE